jgi:hypothetical protein
MGLVDLEANGGAGIPNQTTVSQRLNKSDLTLNLADWINKSPGGYSVKSSV